MLITAALMLPACDQILAAHDQMPAGPTETHTVVPQSLPAFFDCLREHERAIVSAHRGGAHGQLPEHSIQTFEFTLWDAPAFLEIDVRAARDGLVVMHDETVDRTTDGEGLVANLTVDQIGALTLRGMRANEHPPSLREALDWADDKTVLELDIKQNVRFEDIIAEVRAADAMDRVIFITYSVDGASRLARIAPEAMIYTTITSTGDLDTLERRGVDLSHIVAWLGDDQFNEDLVEELAARGVESRFGMFGRGGNFDAAAHAGIQSLAVNDVAEAFAQIDRADGEEGYAALQCVSAG